VPFWRTSSRLKRVMDRIEDITKIRTGKESIKIIKGMRDY
jgi:hypothetical protein